MCFFSANMKENFLYLSLSAFAIFAVISQLFFWFFAHVDREKSANTTRESGGDAQSR